MEFWTQLISSLGFPIVACIVLFWYITKKDDQHKEEVESLREALERNTSAIVKLAEMIGESKNVI